MSIRRCRPQEGQLPDRGGGSTAISRAGGMALQRGFGIIPKTPPSAVSSACPVIL